MLSGNFIKFGLQEAENGAEEASSFSFLPEGNFRNLIEGMDSAMSDILADNLAEGPLTSILINNPLLFLVIFFGVAFSVSLLINFIQDVWKIPVAIVLDVMILMALPQITILSFIAGIGGFIFFIFLFSDLEKLKWVFGAACLLNAILPINMIAMIPLTTSLGLLAAFMTR